MQDLSCQFLKSSAERRPRQARPSIRPATIKMSHSLTHPFVNLAACSRRRRPDKSATTSNNQPISVKTNAKDPLTKAVQPLFSASHSTRKNVIARRKTTLSRTLRMSHSTQETENYGVSWGAHYSGIPIVLCPRYAGRANIARTAQVAERVSLRH
jgi:hypothetical protein